MREKKFVLALKGGGYKGLYQALILLYIEKLYGKPINEMFDLIVGTSIGSINAFALSIGTSAEEIVNTYMDKKGRKVFSQNILTQLNNINFSKYPEKNIGDFIKGFFGNKTMKDCKTKTMSLAYNLTKRQPFLFQSYDREEDVLIYDATKASCSAPTYFPSHSYKGDLLTDGGVMFNDPSLIGYVEATKLFPDCDINILSIGTLFDTNPINIKNGGVVPWAPAIIDLLFSATSEGIDYFIKKLAIKENETYLRLDFEDDTHLAMDDSSEDTIKKLKDYAGKTIVQNKEDIKSFIEMIIETKNQNK